ncbi:intercompartmental signaling factor BofC [Fredinandcohnia quinoae]|uniref:Intercompartmental signaling factor BofC n=1 Tax=Fredinandcohnia quinoae TaxID=2918902 RepID=A0AAW5ECQ1_9BACI|nr:intercompartmental signaling factor BofC [Fredinandcohnia sp. SECRCQ15]MCH1626544.1 intercompartmental signaling factor BofC [Fredinandcohnia sp. SECRCQ15]
MKMIVKIFVCVVIFLILPSFLVNGIGLSEIQEDPHGIEGPLEITVILERVYVDGEVSEELVKETITSMDDFWLEYEDWQLVHQDEEQIVFQQRIDDISPLLKSNGYFGITEDGILTIFNGKPNKSKNKVIQSFFQIDVGKLESYQHKLLKKGIKVGTKDEYINVIETYKTFTSSP